MLRRAPRARRLHISLRAVLLSLGMVAARCGGAEAGGEEFPLPASVREVVTSREAFDRFARLLAPAIEARLARAGSPESEVKLLLGLRVHLALHAGDAGQAGAAAARLRDLQTGAAEKAFAGVLTIAAIHARDAAPEGPGSPAYANAMRRALARELAGLARTAEMRTLLEKQREKIAALTAEALLADAGRLAGQCDPAGHCSLEQADQLVRIGHRLANVVPVRDVIVAAFDAELDARR